MHARWISYIQHFESSIKHQAGKENKVADALSRKNTLLTLLSVEIIAFDHFPKLKEDDEDFGKIWRNCIDHLYMEDFHIIERFLFKGDPICIPHTSLREALIKEAHIGGLAGHFG